MDYTVIFSDIDGTLLTPEHLVSDLTKHIVLSLTKQGVTFIPVSARSPLGIRKVMDSIPLAAPMVCFNGALLLDKANSPIYKLGITAKEALIVKAFINLHFPEIACNLYTKDHMHVDDSSHPFVQRECEITSECPILLSHSTFAEGDCVYKILCLGEPQQTHQLQKAIQVQFPLYATYKSDTTYLEILHKDASKGNALLHYCEINHIPIAKSIAFGDQENDVSMLQAASLGIAMGNAPVPVQQKADVIAASNDEDGLAHMLKNIFSL